MGENKLLKYYSPDTIHVDLYNKQKVDKQGKKGVTGTSFMFVRMVFSSCFITNIRHFFCFMSRENIVIMQRMRILGIHMHISIILFFLHVLLGPEASPRSTLY